MRIDISICHLAILAAIKNIISVYHLSYNLNASHQYHAALAGIVRFERGIVRWQLIFRMRMSPSCVVARPVISIKPRREITTKQYLSSAPYRKTIWPVLDKCSKYKLPKQAASRHHQIDNKQISNGAASISTEGTNMPRPSTLIIWNIVAYVVRANNSAKYNGISNALMLRGGGK